jgi:hypothetical protein
MVLLVPKVTACTTSFRWFMRVAAPSTPPSTTKDSQTTMPPHLPAGQIVLGMAGKAGVVHLAHLGMGIEVLGYCQGRGAVLLHAHRQSFEVLEGHPRLHGRQDRTNELGGVPPDIFDQPLRPDDGTADHGTVSRKKFGNRQKHDIRTQIHRALQCSCGRGIVYQHRHAAGVGDGGHGSMSVMKRQGLLGVSIHTSFVRPSICTSHEPGSVRILDKPEFDIAPFREDIGGLFVAFTVNVEGRDHIVAGARYGEDQFEESLGPGTCSQASFAAFEGRQALLQDCIGGRPRSAIDRAGDFVEGFIRVGDRLHQRRCKGSEILLVAIGMETGMQGYGFDRLPRVRVR